jgi:SAM-dependent methyltransferase
VTGFSFVHKKGAISDTDIPMVAGPLFRTTASEILFPQKLSVASSKSRPVGQKTISSALGCSKSEKKGVLLLKFFSRGREHYVLMPFLLLSLFSPFLQIAAFANDTHPSHYRFTPKIYKGREIAAPMSYLGADWLERDERERLEQPEKVLDVLKITPGNMVADIGAGTGYYSLRLAKRVGPQGRVLATDIQPEMLARLRVNMKKADIRNIDPILCTPTDAKLPHGKLDLALMVDVYHELANPEETMAQVRRALKPGGRLVLIEYRGEDPTVPIKPEHKMTLKQIHEELEPMGFRVQETFDFLLRQHVIVLGPMEPDASAPSP